MKRRGIKEDVSVPNGQEGGSCHIFSCLDTASRCHRHPLRSALAGSLEASTEKVGRAFPALPTNLPTLSVDKL